MGGRAAEFVMYGKVSTGALSDLEKVTKQAYAMVSVYGLNEKLGNVSFYDSSGQNEYGFSKPYSDQTAQMIDQEVRILVEGQYERAKKILTENKDKLTALATQLLEKEVIFKEDLEKIFGDRPFARQEQVTLLKPVNGSTRALLEKADESTPENTVNPSGATSPEKDAAGNKGDTDNTSIA
jgi:cell division protease FtsH